MGSIALLTIILALAAGAAFADFGDVIYSWDVPTLRPSYDRCFGLAYDGNYIWCNCDILYADDVVMRCVPSSGSLVSSFANPFRTGSRGMTYRKFAGQNVLEMAVNNNGQYLIGRVNFAGRIIDRVTVNLPGNQPFPSVCFDGTNNWVVDEELAYNIIYKLTSTGAPVSSFRVNDVGGGQGIDKQGDFFWLSVDYPGATPSFFGGVKILPTGSIVASFRGLYQSVYDCCCEDNHFWFVGRNCKVYCVDVADAPAVVPASVGRVKALFR